MPTGYTAGILDGTTTTFQQFAKLCMRAFGATVHMRDEDMDAPYKEQKPSSYHKKRIDAANKAIKDANELPDQWIIDDTKINLEKSKKYHQGAIEKNKVNRKKLTNLLEEAKLWQPPTPDHTNIKEFMIEQISTTINHDCNDQYHAGELIKIQDKSFTIDPKSIRKEMIQEAKRDLEYHTEQLELEIKRCKESNKWVSDLLNSLAPAKNENV